METTSGGGLTSTDGMLAGDSQAQLRDGVDPFGELWEGGSPNPSIGQEEGCPVPHSDLLEDAGAISTRLGLVEGVGCFRRREPAVVLGSCPLKLVCLGTRNLLLQWVSQYC